MIVFRLIWLIGNNVRAIKNIYREREGEVGQVKEFNRIPHI